MDDLGVATQIAVFVAQGGDGNLGPEPGSVLAHTLGLLAKPALSGGDRKLFRWLPGVALLSRKDTRDVLAEDLRFGPASDPFGTGVPTGYATLTVKHEDGVVLDPVYQLVEALLAVLQRQRG